MASQQKVVVGVVIRLGSIIAGVCSVRWVFKTRRVVYKFTVLLGVRRASARVEFQHKPSAIECLAAIGGHLHAISQIAQGVDRVA